MRVAIDCRTILNPGFGEGAGIGHYTYHLVWHLLRLSSQVEFVLFFDKRLARQAIQNLIGGRPKVEIRYFPFYEYRQYLPGLYSHLLVSSAIAREAPDILHVPGGAIPASYNAKVVLTVHDLAIFRHPEWFPFQPLSVKLFYPQSLRKASHLIVPSQATANDLQEIFKIPKGKISVIYEGVVPRGRLYSEDILSKDDVTDIKDLENKYGIRTPYLFFLGTIEPRKNLEFLVQVFDELLQRISSPHSSSPQKGGEEDEGVQLVLTGARGWKHEKIFKIIKAVNKKYKRINYIGYVPHQDKWALFENATCFVYPSLYEGFGLPPLEAMACGIPIIASNVGSLPEVIGNGGILLPPTDKVVWVLALEKILKEPAERARLSEVGKKQAARFSWSKCAEETLEVYQRILAH